MLKMESLKQMFQIRLYPDNPMSILTDVFFGGILLYFLYLILFHDLIGYTILVWKGMLEIERKPLPRRQREEDEMGEDTQEVEIDVNHEIGSALAYSYNPENLIRLETATGVNAYEVYEFMNNLLIDEREILSKRRGYTQISNDEISYRVYGGEMIVRSNGEVTIKTGYGYIYTSVIELNGFVTNPYKFEQIAVQLNLV